MEEIIVLSGTNRPDSNTLKVSKIYEKLVNTVGGSARILDLKLLPENFAFSETFGNRSEAYADFLRDYVITKNKFIFVVPEYNGSFPGILKLFLDSTHPRDWAGKKVCLVGVADGRAGNLRGMDHLTGILHYLKIHVMPNKLPISVVKTLLNEAGEFSSESQIKFCTAQVKEFLEF